MNRAIHENQPGYRKPSLQRLLRVIRLRNLVAHGQYRVDIEALAEVLIEREFTALSSNAPKQTLERP